MSLSAKSAIPLLFDQIGGDSNFLTTSFAGQVAAMTKTKISVRIPEQFGKEVKVLAKIAGRSTASILTEALELYIERQRWIRGRPRDCQ